MTRLEQGLNTWRWLNTPREHGKLRVYEACLLRLMTPLGARARWSVKSDDDIVEVTMQAILDHKVRHRYSGECWLGQSRSWCPGLEIHGHMNHRQSRMLLPHDWDLLNGNSLLIYSQSSICVFQNVFKSYLGRRQFMLSSKLTFGHWQRT